MTFQPSTVLLLEETGSEDPMELSLDTDRRATGDEDIEIDLDLAGDPVTGPDDDDDMVEYDGSIIVQDHREDIFASTDEQMIDEPSNDVEESLDHTTELRSIPDEDFNDNIVLVPEADQNIVPTQSDQPVPKNGDEYFLSNLQPGNQNPDDQEQQVSLENNNPDIDSDKFGPLNAEKLVDQHAVDQSLVTSSPEVLGIAHDDEVAPISDVEEYYDDEEESKKSNLLEDTVVDIDGLNKPSDSSSNMLRNHQGHDESPDGHVDDSLPQESSQIHSSTNVEPSAVLERYANEESAATNELDEVVAPPEGRSETIEGNITNGKNLDLGQAGIEQAEEDLDDDEFEYQDKSELHPVLVNYQDNEISLFPPKNDRLDDSQTYFLQDERYAWDSLQDLLNACKTILEEDIEDYEELEISFQGLDLCINQSCVEATTTSLAEILDIYTQLHYQDNNSEDAPPLMINLSTKTQFSKRLEYLRETAAEGTGSSKSKPLEKPTEDDFLPEQSTISQANDNKEQIVTGVPNQLEDTGDKDEEKRSDSRLLKDMQSDQRITQAEGNGQTAISTSSKLDKDQIAANSTETHSADYGEISNASDIFSASLHQPAYTEDDSLKRTDPKRAAEDGTPKGDKDRDDSYSAVELRSDTISKNPRIAESTNLNKEDYDTVEDEITYEDEYEDEDETGNESNNINLDATSQAASLSRQDISSSPTSLKRTRNDLDNDPLDQKVQDSKRVRSQ